MERLKRLSAGHYRTMDFEYEILYQDAMHLEPGERSAAGVVRGWWNVYEMHFGYNDALGDRYPTLNAARGALPQFRSEMKKSKRQAHKMKRGRDEMLSTRFEAKLVRSKRRRKGEKAGRKAARKGRK